MSVTYIAVDVEASGPCPPLYSLISIGAVVIGRNNPQTFYRELAPLEGAQFNEGALNACGYTQEELESYTNDDFYDPFVVMHDFETWIKMVSNGSRVILVTDNPYFDSAYLNYYFHAYVGRNPFGFSSFSLTSFYKGHQKNMKASFKHLRKTKHTHNALDDAKGNAEAFLTIMRDVSYV
jgi:DNA polymerase III alpha subunit (gram-positive type)